MEQSYPISLITEAGSLDVVASLVLYNTRPEEIEEVAKCLRSAPVKLAIVAVDNSRKDDLRQSVEASGISYIWAGSNLGFGAAQNIALRQTVNHAKYRLVINSDVSFGEDVIPRLYRFMEDHPEVGLVMPRIMNLDGTEQRLCKLLPSPVDLLVRRFFGLPGKLLFKKRWAQYEMETFDLSVIREVPSLSGCFMFIRSSALQETGLFDERFFMYMEDVDLCRRIGQSSKTVFYPLVSVVHGYAKGSYRNRKLFLYHVESAIQYFSKWGWFCDYERRDMNKRTSRM
jgi:GT2 family glycosyltransferase